MTINGEPWPAVRARLVDSARASYPKAESDLDAVALSLSHSLGAIHERNEVRTLNAHQASRIAQLTAKIKEMEARERAAQ